MSKLFISVVAIAAISLLRAKHSIYYDQDKAVNYPDGSCNTQHFQCLSAEKQFLIRSFAATTPYDCCKTCLSETNCKSWTHYYINATYHYQYQTNNHPFCELYSVPLNHSSSNITAGNCVNGEPYSGPPRINFVLYYPDTVRAEYLSVLGYPLPTTPNLESFAKEGVTFMNHIAQHSECSPSRQSMLTGRYLHNDGQRTLTNLIQPWQPSYLRWLKDSGFYVLWLGKNDALSIDTFPLTCNEWSGDIGFESGSNLYKFGEVGYYSFLFSGGDIDGNSTKNGDYNAVFKTKQFLESNPPTPFVVFLPGRGGHPPYGAPKKYHTMFDAKTVESTYPLRPPYMENKPNYFSKAVGIPYWHNYTEDTETFNITQFYQLNAIYLGMLNYMDWNFGQLWSAIKEYDNMTTTALFMSSDHGDYTGDHRFVEKWPGGMDDQLIHIPFVGYIPGNHGGAKINGPTESFDLFETIFEYNNINRSYVSWAKSLLKQFMTGKENNVDLERYAFTEGGFDEYHTLFPCGDDHTCSPKSLYYPKNAEEQQMNGTGCPRVVSMRGIDYKLVFRESGVNEFYDLKQDPTQLNNLFDSNNVTIQSIKNNMFYNLTKWYLKTADYVPILTDPRGLPKDIPN